MENTALKMFTDTVKGESGYIFVRPLCEFFQIHYRNQASKIKSDPKIATQVRNFALESLFGDNREHLSLTKKGFLIWILSINASTVAPELQGKFIQYQTYLSDFLFGTVEEHELISKLNTELQLLKRQYSELGNLIRNTQKELNEALNQRYQYRLDFNSRQELPV